jgi:cytochrome P450
VAEDQYPALDFDPFSDEFLTDPYPFHERLREAGPVVWLERYRVWGMARHRQVNAALMNWEAFSSAAGVGLSNFNKEKPWRTPSIILEADPPLHTRTHKILTRALSPMSLHSLRADFEHEAERLVEELVERVTFDGVADLSRAYPLKIFPDALGIAPEGREALLAYGEMVFNAFGPRNERFERSMANAAAVTAAITAMCERDALDPSGIGAQVYRSVEEGVISYDEARLLVRSLLSAGLDTTVSAIGNALYLLARNVGEWRTLRDNPQLVRTAFDEALRLESPVQTFFRTTTRAFEVEGVRIPEGDKVLLFYGAANRDPRRWIDPNRFDIKRRSGGHVAFGTGVHRCVGEALSRIEGECILSALAARVKSLALDGKPKLRLNNTLRGFETMGLTVKT